MNALDIREGGAPWHDGELEAQRRAGVVKRMDGVGRRFVRAYMPDQHRIFFAQLPFIVVGSVDSSGWPWASILSGTPGFISSPDPRTLHIAARAVDGDPLGNAMSLGTPLGLLGIELPTRRRNRMNGHVTSLNADRFIVAVDQSFGNCAQYIQTRNGPPLSGCVSPAVRCEPFTTLDEHARRLIERSDTFFVASYARPSHDGGYGVDVSHRGGRIGFLGFDDTGSIVVPDYPGNSFFNTIGNLVATPRAGVLFIDFDSGDLLQFVGATEIAWEGREVRAFKGAERLWRLEPRQGRWLRGAMPIRFSFKEASPNVLVTGTWRETQEALEAENRRESWRQWRVTRIVDESHDVRSLYLEAADGLGVPRFLAGQHLPIRLRIPGQTPAVSRSYTVSCAPGDGLQITVRRARDRTDGEPHASASAYVHRHLSVNSIIEALGPRGGFVFDTTSPKPAVLLSAGIGITPMRAMLRHAVNEHTRTRRMRPIYFIHSARTSTDRPFREELQALADQKADHVRLHFASTAPRADEVSGLDYQSTGRIDIDLLRRILPFDDYHFYLCGPDGFMQSLYDGLRGLNVADQRIHVETFGESSFRRSASRDSAEPGVEHQIEVVFSRSGKRARWTSHRSLLELAEACGLNPAHECRNGACGTCATRVLNGVIEYPRIPIAETVPGEALICLAVPRISAIESNMTVTLDL
jgi:ferredoxin-NADP reductase/predicted pyridoxine 5'-phosphate oxidase superfamily flavin-nucleotide-binding protein